MCFPRWADPAIFAGLLGAPGTFSVEPTARAVWGGFYEEGTLIWRSRWVTDDGIVESRDALAYPGAADHAILLRRVTSVRGRNSVEVFLEPGPDYGGRAFDQWHRHDGTWRATDGATSVAFTAGPGARLHRRGGQPHLRQRLVLDEGQHHDLMFQLVAGPMENLSNIDTETTWRATEAAWRAAVPPCPDVVAARDVRRSFAVLRGLTNSAGATVAAATTSLPERARRGRNYDYRYAWTRDVCYSGEAGAALPGGEAMLDDAVRWISARLLEHGPQLAPAYTDQGAPVPRQHRLELPGYPGGSDIVGNHVRDQFQLDVFGEALLLFAAAARADRLDADGWRAAQAALEAIADRWHQPDAGVWELDARPWTHSRLICVAGLRAICAAGGPAGWGGKWLPLADTIAADTAATSLDPSGHWRRAPDDDRVDGALLLAQIRGAVAPDDPRSRATRQAIVSTLSEDGYLYRYRHPGQRPDDAEGAFLICNFWMALACLADGESVEAVRWFERARSACGPPGLMSEEFDVNEHQLRGNLPQAFVHALLIEAAASQGGG